MTYSFTVWLQERTGPRQLQARSRLMRQVLDNRHGNSWRSWRSGQGLIALYCSSSTCAFCPWEHSYNYFQRRRQQSWCWDVWWSRSQLGQTIIDVTGTKGLVQEVLESFLWYPSVSIACGELAAQYNSGQAMIPHCENVSSPA